MPKGGARVGGTSSWLSREKVSSSGGPLWRSGLERGASWQEREGGIVIQGLPLHIYTGISTSSTPPGFCPCLLPISPFHTCTHLSPDVHREKSHLYNEQLGLEGSSVLCPRHSLLFTWLSLILVLFFTTLPLVVISMLGPTGTSDTPALLPKSTPSPVCQLQVQIRNLSLILDFYFACSVHYQALLPPRYLLLHSLFFCFPCLSSRSLLPLTWTTAGAS